MLCDKTKKLVYVATDAELVNEHYYRRLMLAARNVPISRRSWLDEIANAFRDNTDTNILFLSGEPFPIPDVDEVFGDDPDCRWFSDFFQLDGSGENPRKRSRKIDRVRLIDLYFRLNHPGIAKHFGR